MASDADDLDVDVRAAELGRLLLGGLSALPARHLFGREGLEVDHVADIDIQCLGGPLAEHDLVGRIRRGEPPAHDVRDVEVDAVAAVGAGGDVDVLPARIHRAPNPTSSAAPRTSGRLRISSTCASSSVGSLSITSGRWVWAISRSTAVRARIPPDTSPVASPPAIPITSATSITDPSSRGLKPRATRTTAPMRRSYKSCPGRPIMQASPRGGASTTGWKPASVSSTDHVSMGLNAS